MRANVNHGSQTVEMYSHRRAVIAAMNAPHTKISQLNGHVALIHVNEHLSPTDLISVGLSMKIEK